MTNNPAKTTSAIASTGQERLWYLCKIQQPAYCYNEQFDINSRKTADPNS